MPIRKNTLFHYLNQFDENYHHTIIKIVRSCGGWTEFSKLNTTPRYEPELTSKEWFDFWNEQVREDSLITHYKRQFKTLKGFTPTFKAMSWIVDDQLKQHVINYLKEQLHE